MSNAFLHIASPGIASIQPYKPGKPVSELERELGICNSLKLASNENPIAVSQRVKDVLQSEFSELARYPDGAGFTLREALAKRHGVASKQITIGNGSNDVLDMIARVFLSPGFQSVFSQHAFAVYPIASMSVGADLVAVPAVEFGHDLHAMLNAITDKTRVVWIANPNNPTGTWLNEAELMHFVEQVPSDVMIVIDEAYSEYVHLDDYPDATQWITRFPNVIVTRTFSKAFGLAALRVGYSVSHPDVADLLNRVRQPFNVNSFAQAGAVAALDDDEYLAESIRVNDEGLVQLSQGLDKLGLTYIPSVGNFVAVNVGRPVAEVDKALLMEGVITRPVENYGLQHHLRISVGLQAENARALIALEKVL